MCKGALDSCVSKVSEQHKGDVVDGGVYVSRCVNSICKVYNGCSGYRTMLKDYV